LATSRGHPCTKKEPKTSTVKIKVSTSNKKHNTHTPIKNYVSTFFPQIYKQTSPPSVLKLEQRRQALPKRTGGGRQVEGALAAQLL
jgi:hypothetical protein